MKIAIEVEAYGSTGGSNVLDLEHWAREQLQHQSFKVWDASYEVADVITIESVKIRDITNE